MVTAFLFIQLIGDMTNDCGNKRGVRLGGRWMFSQPGEVGEVPLVLACGQSFCAVCLSAHHPGVRKQDHVPPPGPPGTLFTLLVNEHHVTLLHS